MIKGVSEKEYLIISEIISKYPFEFYAYGSRIRGGFSGLSDLDLMLKDKKAVSVEVLCCLKDDFDKSNLPYIVNFTDYHTLNSNFYNLIKDDLIKLQ